MKHFVSLNLYLTHQTDINQGGTLFTLKIFQISKKFGIPTYLTLTHQPPQADRCFKGSLCGASSVRSGFAHLPVTIWLWFTMIGRSWRICTSATSATNGKPRGCLLEKKVDNVTLSLVTRVGSVWLVGRWIDWMIDLMIWCAHELLTMPNGYRGFSFIPSLKLTSWELEC